MVIHKFLGNSLIKRLEKTRFQTKEEIRAQLKPTSEAGKGEWLDLSGLILPQVKLQELIETIESGLVRSLEDIQQFFQEMHHHYYDMEWTWAYEKIERFYDLRLSEIEPEQIVSLVRKWQEAVIGLDEKLYKDAQKEFSLTAMTGFGVDGTAEEKQADFALVRGLFESNSFVTAVKEHMVVKRALGDELIDRLKPLLNG